MGKITLKYIGDGSHVVGIPAKDLTTEQAKECGGEAFLLSLKPPLYEKVKTKTTTKKVTESSKEG